MNVLHQTESRRAAEHTGQQKAHDRGNPDFMTDQKDADGEAEEFNDIGKKRYFHTQQAPFFGSRP